MVLRFFARNWFKKKHSLGYKLGVFIWEGLLGLPILRSWYYGFSRGEGFNKKQ